jgi:hypothetical protein
LYGIIGTQAMRATEVTCGIIKISRHRPDIVALFAILSKHGNEPITFSNADTFLARSPANRRDDFYECRL